jgi:allantoate deiminase
MRFVHLELTAWMNQVGLDVHIDGAGNIHGRSPGFSDDASRLFIGSHLDTVPRAGAFDGVLGVALGIALLETVQDTRFPFAIEVIGFSDEEGVRFGVPFIGSRAFSGTFDNALLETRDAAGITIAGAIRDYGLGLEPDAIDEAAVKGPAVGYLEFHIEQGLVLDTLDAPLGIVDSIVGQTRVDATFTGAAGHVGTTPMHVRRDALAGAADWIVAVEREAHDTPGLVATVGRIDAQPGASNVIAGTCSTTLDVRHADDRARSAAVARMANHARSIAARRGLDVAWTPRLDQPAVAMDPSLVGALERAVQRAGVPVHHLSSGAGHDAMIVAARMPAAMLFVRSPGGISHHPDESVIEEDVAVALETGRYVLDELTRDLRE